MTVQFEVLLRTQSSIRWLGLVGGLRFGFSRGGFDAVGTGSSLCSRGAWRWRFDALGDIGQDLVLCQRLGLSRIQLPYLLSTQHPIGVEARVAIWRGDAGQAVLERMKHERHLHRVFEGNLVLWNVSLEAWLNSQDTCL